MKKYFLFVFVFTLLALSTSISAEGKESTLLNSNNFEIKTNGFIEKQAEVSLLAQKSNLTVIFKDDKIGDIEPDVNITISKKDGTPVLLIKSPSTKISENNSGFVKYLQDNKVYFQNVVLNEGSLTFSTPLDYEQGEYKLDVELNMNGTNKTILYIFNVSNSPYVFSESDITIEESDILGNIGYVSFLNEEKVNKVVITLVQGKKELFRKEFDKTFYYRGSILLDENIPELEKIKGEANVVVEIRNMDGSVLLSQTKTINIPGSKNKYLFYVYIIVLVIIAVASLIYMKKRKNKILFLSALFFMGASLVVVPLTINAVELCGTVPKPADVCLEDGIKTTICKLTNICEVQEPTLRKFFSTGKRENLQSPKQWVGPVSTSVNICSEISTTLNSGDGFYVASDSSLSSWQRKRFHIFGFTKGTIATVTFDPGGRKRNVNYATYDGGCNVIVYGKYSGKASDHKYAKTTIVEVGASTNTLCKSPIVNSDAYETNGDLLTRATCVENEVRDTYISGGVRVNPPQSAASSWTEKTVDICPYLGYTASTIPTGKKFYALTSQTSSWTLISFPVFQFQFGQVNNSYIRSLSTNAGSYYYKAYKENSPQMKYDGGCNVTFRLYNYGADTSSWNKGFSLVELGMVDNVTCMDPVLTLSSTATTTGSYKYSGRGLYNGEVEFETKKVGGKYDLIAPFIKTLSNCVPLTQCTIYGEWIDSYNDNLCTEPLIGVCDTESIDSCIIGDPVNIRVENGQNKWDCSGLNGGTTTPCTAFSLSCTAPSVPVESQVTFTATPTNASGTVLYSWAGFPGEDTNVLIKTDGYDSAGPHSVDVQGTDASGSVANTSCLVSITNNCPPPQPADILCSGSVTTSTTYSCVGTNWVGTDSPCSNCIADGVLHCNSANLQNVYDSCDQIINICVSPKTCTGAGQCTGGSGEDNPCTKDGLTFPHNTVRKFFKNRIASSCMGEWLICNNGNWKNETIELPDSIDNYKFKTCVTPEVSEF
jgi:hypothetical protein